MLLTAFDALTELSGNRKLEDLNLSEDMQQSLKNSLGIKGDILAKTFDDIAADAALQKMNQSPMFDKAKMPVLKTYSKSKKKNSGSLTVKPSTNSKRLAVTKDPVQLGHLKK